MISSRFPMGVATRYNPGSRGPYKINNKFLPIFNNYKASFNQCLKTGLI